MASYRCEICGRPTVVETPDYFIAVDRQLGVPDMCDPCFDRLCSADNDPGIPGLDLPPLKIGQNP